MLAEDMIRSCAIEQAFAKLSQHDIRYMRLRLVHELSQYDAGYCIDAVDDYCGRHGDFTGVPN